MTKTRAQKLLKEWQAELKLRDWTVKLVVDKTLADHGNINWDDLTKDATIWLYPAKEDAIVEKVIIHELLHLVFLKWTEMRDVEECITHMTSVLYDMKHKND